MFRFPHQLRKRAERAIVATQEYFARDEQFYRIVNKCELLRGKKGVRGDPRPSK